MSAPLRSMKPVNLADAHNEQEPKHGCQYTPAGSSAQGTTLTQPAASGPHVKKTLTGRSQNIHTVATCTTKTGAKNRRIAGRTFARRSLGKLRVPVEVIPPRQMAIPRRVAPRHRLQLQVCRLDGNAAEDRLARPLQLGNCAVALAMIAVDARGDNVLPVAPTSLATRHDVVESEVLRRKPLATILRAQREMPRAESSKGPGTTKTPRLQNRRGERDGARSVSPNTSYCKAQSQSTRGQTVLRESATRKRQAQPGSAGHLPDRKNRPSRRR